MNAFPTDLYLHHYFRLTRLHCGPNVTDTPKAGDRRVDELGIKAITKLRAIYPNERKPGLIEALAFMGKRWESGWSRFEERVAALGSPVTEGAMLRVQAA